MTEADWSDPALRTLVARLSHAGDVVVIGVHAGAEPTWVRLPVDDHAYDLVLDTRSAAASDTIPYRIGAGRRLDLAARTVVLLTAARPHRGAGTPAHRGDGHLPHVGPTPRRCHLLGRDGGDELHDHDGFGDGLHDHDGFGQRRATSGAAVSGTALTTSPSSAGVASSGLRGSTRTV